MKSKPKQQPKRRETIIEVGFQDPKTISEIVRSVMSGSEPDQRVTLRFIEQKDSGNSDVAPAKETPGENSSSIVAKKKNLSFDYAGDEKKFIHFIHQLDKKIKLVKTPGTLEDFIGVFLSKSIVPESKTIHLHCDSTQFCYIISCLQKHFRSLTYSNVGKTKMFRSDKGTPITENTFYQVRKKNKDNPKGVEIIDAIFKQW